MKVLGIFAHPDDVEIYCLGTLAALSLRGDEIGWIVATDGARGGVGDAEALARTRRAEASAAASPFGVTPVFLGRSDGSLPADAALTEVIEEQLSRLSPGLVLTHDPKDYHPDHRALSRAVADAARFKVPVVFTDTLMGVAFTPGLYVDVTAHMDAKIAAIRAHASQRPERFVQACTSWNRFRAMQCNAWATDTYAEAFRFDPVFPFADIRHLLPPAPRIRAMGPAGVTPPDV